MNINILFRRFHNGLFYKVRKWHMRSYVHKLKKSHTNAKILTTTQRKAIKSFYKDYGRVNPLFHNFYTEKTGVFSEKYIPDDLYYNNINLFYNNHLLAKSVDHKGYYHAIFPDIPQPHVVACRKGGFWFTGYEPLAAEKLTELLKTEKAVFIKLATDSGGGSGVQYLEPANCGDFETAFQKCIQSMHGDLIIQRSLEQHKALAMLNESSVNTLRILSLLRDGKVTIYSSILRMGSHGAKVDNSSSGGISVGITDEGKLKEFAYYTKGTSLSQHPDSGIVFKDYQLPSFKEAKALVQKAHWYIPHFRMVSWDVAIDPEGHPVLIEANMTDGQLDFHQLNNGPLFGNDTKMILDEVFGK